MRIDTSHTDEHTPHATLHFKIQISGPSISSHDRSNSSHCSSWWQFFTSWWVGEQWDMKLWPWVCVLWKLLSRAGTSNHIRNSSIHCSILRHFFIVLISILHNIRIPQKLKFELSNHSGLLMISRYYSNQQ